MKRKIPLETGQYYHVFNRSLSGITLFNGRNEYLRMLDAIQFFQYPASMKFSTYREILLNSKEVVDFGEDVKIVQIIAYCLMPNHIHFVLKQAIDGGISTFLSNIQNSYARYFNLKYERQGPLWRGRFGNVLVKSDEQMLHVTRYIHLNPTTSTLVDDPQDWRYSSYREYVNPERVPIKICSYNDILDIVPNDYRAFVVDYIDEQKELARQKDADTPGVYTPGVYEKPEKNPVFG